VLSRHNFAYNQSALAGSSLIFVAKNLLFTAITKWGSLTGVSRISDVYEQSVATRQRISTLLVDSCGIWPYSQSRLNRAKPTNAYAANTNISGSIGVDISERYK